MQTETEVKQTENVLIALPTELYEAIKVLAEKDVRSWRSEIAVLLREAVDARNSSAPK